MTLAPAAVPPRTTLVLLLPRWLLCATYNSSVSGSEADHVKRVIWPEFSVGGAGAYSREGWRTGAGAAVREKEGARLLVYSLKVSNIRV